jgi:hypothetical protein
MIRKLEDLEANALKFWPEEISQLERNSSIIPSLIVTLDKFISLLNIADSEPFAWKNALIASSQLSANLLLKHLMVLSDISGEKLMRFKSELANIFENELMVFSWKGANYIYKFQTLFEKKTWNNDNLKVDGEGLSKNELLSPLMEDVVNLILFGGASTAENIPHEIMDKCNIGTLLGNKDELDNFVRQRYIWVSRITGGATANSLGYFAQKYVLDYLKNILPEWDFSKKTIDKITQNNRTLVSFDIVSKSPKGNFCAIEISFQVTTNSTIERKAGQAKERHEQLSSYGHKIAYIIDGAGNFERKSALKTICAFSDCTVTFKEDELKILSDFLKNLDK